MGQSCLIINEVKVDFLVVSSFLSRYFAWIYNFIGLFGIENGIVKSGEQDTAECGGLVDAEVNHVVHTHNLELGSVL
jgi:hypothetical protein